MSQMSSGTLLHHSVEGSHVRRLLGSSIILRARQKNKKEAALILQHRRLDGSPCFCTLDTPLPKLKLIAELQVATFITQKKSRYFTSISNIRTVLGEAALFVRARYFASKEKAGYFCITENSMGGSVSVS